MKNSLLPRISVLLGSLLLAAGAQATQLTLPAANEMSVGVYNDFNVYSLDLLKQCSVSDPRCQPTIGVPVQSSPGQIADQAVILTSANGMSNFTSPFAVGTAVNDVFLTPTGNQSSSYTMVDTGGAFTGDLANRWDISLGALQDYLGMYDLVFLFDNNQRGTGQSQWVNIWGQARITDAMGNTISCFELSTGSGCLPGANPSAGDYLPVAADFCVDKVTGLSYNMGTASNDNDCAPNGMHPSGGYYISNNLGTNAAEFAAFNQALNDAAKNPLNANYFLSLDVKYTGNNAGAEQLWICSQCMIDGETDVPEPGSLPLVAMGALAGLLAVAKRRVH